MVENENYLKLNEQNNYNYTMTDGAAGTAGVGGGGGSVAGNGGSSMPLNFNERFPCSVCGKSYLRKRHLQRHMRDECIGIPPRFSCDLCPSRFRRKYHMVRHLTSKHGIPPNIAQQTTGNTNRSNASTHCKDEAEFAENLSLNQQNLGNCDNDALPENLTMRKEIYEQTPIMQHHPYPTQPHHQHLNMGDSQSPSQITSGDSGSDCNDGGTAGTSPIPPAHVMPIPTYGLTGAITAISAAAAHVEEKDAKILLEAAAAAAQAAANNNLQHSANNNNNINNIANIMIPPSNEDTENVAENQTATTIMAPTNINTEAFIKNEPASATMNMLDDEWKMKLSLQLISNSLLKERLMNTMPFAYKNN